jgi:hypothetical protein
MIVDKMDAEFKLFMRWRGVNIDGQLFDLTFEEPQNFAQYRQADIDTARISTFTALESYPYFSKRYLMKRYLGMTEQEMSENEMEWAEEQGDVDQAAADDPTLRNIGISPGGIAGDLDNVTPLPAETAMPGEAPGATQGISPMGGPAAPAAPTATGATI